MTAASLEDQSTGIATGNADARAAVGLTSTSIIGRDATGNADARAAVISK
jgi:hypothetical protein